MKKIEEVQEIMKKYEENVKAIEKQYTEKSKELLDAETEERRASNNLEKLEEELKKLNVYEMNSIEMRTTVATYNEMIAVAKKMKEEAVNAKNEILSKDSKNKLQKEKDMSTSILNNETKTRQELTKMKIELQKELETAKLLMKTVLNEQENFKYTYEVKDGVNVPTNGDEFKKLVDDYGKLSENALEIEEAIKFCDDSLNEFKEKDNKRVEKINNILHKKEEFEKVDQSGKAQQVQQTQSAQQEQQAQQTQSAQQVQQAQSAQQSQPAQQGQQAQQAQSDQQAQSVQTSKNDIQEGNSNKPLKKIKIDINKDGSQVEVMREIEPNEALYWSPDITDRMSFDELKSVANQIKNDFGDKWISRSIISAGRDEKLTIYEVNEQLTLCKKIFNSTNKKEIDDLKKKLKFDINYHLKGMRKSSLSKSDRKELEVKAKLARELGIAKVYAPWYIETKWKLQDFRENIKENITKLPNKIKSLSTKKQEALNSGENTEQKNKKIKGKVNDSVKRDRFGNPIEKSSEDIKIDDYMKKMHDAADKKIEAKDNEQNEKVHN